MGTRIPHSNLYPCRLTVIIAYVLVRTGTEAKAHHEYLEMSFCFLEDQFDRYGNASKYIILSIVQFQKFNAYSRCEISNRNLELYVLFSSVSTILPFRVHSHDNAPLL